MFLIYNVCCLEFALVCLLVSVLRLGLGRCKRSDDHMILAALASAASIMRSWLRLQRPKLKRNALTKKQSKAIPK